MFKLFCKETDEQIRERLLKLCKEGDWSICPPPMEAIVAINELKQFFLGEDWEENISHEEERLIAGVVCQIKAKCIGHCGKCPQPMNADTAIDELTNFFLGEDWYVTMPIGREQVISEIVYSIETQNKKYKAK